MTILKLELITILLGLIWFDWLGLHRKILNAFGKQPFDDFKPFSCYFCTMQWIGFIIIISYGIWSEVNNVDFFEWIEVAFWFIVLNLVVSRILDNLLGYDSIKAK